MNESMIFKLQCAEFGRLVMFYMKVIGLMIDGFNCVYLPYVNTVLNPFPILSQLILLTTFSGEYWVCHLTDEKIEAQKGYVTCPGSPS